MSKVAITESHLSDIADAIRGKNGQSAQYTPGQMAAAIQSIPTGTSPTGTISITANGTVDVTDYASASVSVPNTYAAGDEGKVVSGGALVAQTARASEITANGTYDTTNNNSVTVNVSGGGSSGRCGIFDLFTFTSQGGDGMSLAVHNGLPSIYRNSNYNWHLCTNAVVPASATKLYITIEAARRGTSYDRWLYIGRYESSLSDTFVEIARLQDSSMSVSELLGQSSIIDLNITENDNLPFQTVVLDTSDISSAFHVGFFSDYQAVYLYNIYYE